MLHHRLAALAVLAFACAPVFAAECAVEIEGNDAMQFNKPVIEVSQSCKEFKVTLKHSGKMPKQAMGHNWVLAKTADIQAIATDGIAAGAAQNYSRPAMRASWPTRRCSAAARATASASPHPSSPPTAATPTSAPSPGHSALMKGTIKLVK